METQWYTLKQKISEMRDTMYTLQKESERSAYHHVLMLMDVLEENEN